MMEKQSQDMEELHLAYKSDSFGNDILTRLNWAKESTRTNRPIGIDAPAAVWEKSCRLQFSQLLYTTPAALLWAVITLCLKLR